MSNHKVIIHHASLVDDSGTVLKELNDEEIEIMQEAGNQIEVKIDVNTSQENGPILKIRKYRFP